MNLPKVPNFWKVFLLLLYACRNKTCGVSTIITDGNKMKTKTIISKIYGYAVCLTSIIAFLGSTTSVVSSLIDFSNPLYAGWRGGGYGSPSLASFENYKTDVLKVSTIDGQSAKSAYTPDDQTLHTMYESAKNERIQYDRHHAINSIIRNGLLIVLSIVFFALHWRWVQKLSRDEV